MGTFAIERIRVFEAPRDLVWSVVSDTGSYHEVVSTLSHTEVVSGHGQGMVRHCRDTKGREWNETCTVWEEGETVQMTVDVDTYPSSFRAIFSRVVGTWSVATTAGGTAVTMRFDGETKMGPIGKAAVAAMGRETVFGSIVDGYEDQIRQRLAPGSWALS